MAAPSGKKAGGKALTTDVNIGNVSSQLATKINLAVGNMDPQWKTVGQQPGLQVFRIDSYRLVAVPPKEVGTFHSANCYLVIKTDQAGQGLRWQAHMWIGADASVDDAGTAAVKLGELDELLGPSVFMAREMQGHESQAFLSYFPEVREVLGAADERRPSAQTARLFRVKGPRGGVVLSQMVATASSLNGGDAFLIDAGATIFAWHGASCSPHERGKAAEVASGLASSRSPPANVVFLEENGAIPADFWALLGGQSPISPPTAAGDDETVASTKRLFRLTDGQSAAPPTAADGSAPPTAQVKLTPTVVSPPNFDADADAKMLRKAVKGLGTDERVLIDIIGARTNEQRQAIRRAYKAQFNRDLVKDVEDDTSGNFRQLLAGLLRSPHAYDAYCLRKAMKGAGTDEQCLIEILCNRTNAQLSAIIQKYKNDYERELAADIVGDTSGDFKYFLLEILKCTRDESNVVDPEGAVRDAQMLYKAGEARWGTDERKFIEILTQRNPVHLRRVFEEYRKISKKNFTIFDAIKSETSGDFKRALLAIAQCAVDPVPYFSERLYKSMKGLGTDDRALVRIVTSRSEVDLGAIKEHFAKEHPEMPLTDMIIDDTSGDYKRLLLKVVGPESTPKSSVAAGPKAPQMFMNEVASGRITRGHFASDDAFVFDAGLLVFVWIGRGASAAERRSGLAYAQDYLSAYNRPLHTPIVRVAEGAEGDIFYALLDQ